MPHIFARTTTSKFSVCTEIQGPSCGTRASAFEMLADADALRQSSEGPICTFASLRSFGLLCKNMRSVRIAVQKYIW